MSSPGWGRDERRLRVGGSLQLALATTTLSGMTLRVAPDGLGEALRSDGAFLHTVFRTCLVRFCRTGLACYRSLRFMKRCRNLD